jgi:sugar/nucleoside kinase (ribokinase family)
MIATNSHRSAVLSIGRIYCDLIFTGLDEMPVLGRELFAGGLDIAAGGGAFISAAHVAQVGRKVALVSRLGTDIEHAADAGPQITVAAVVGKDRAFLTRRAGPAQPQTLEAALAWPQAQHLHIAEYATLHEMPDLVSRAKAQGLTVSLDPSWDASLIYAPGFLEACRGVDVFLPNLEEAEAITGSADPQAAITMLGKSFATVALKGGPSGAWVVSGGGILHSSAKAVPVVDTTGAGDAFNAGFLHAWLDGGTLSSCLSAGIDAGSLAVQTAGGATALRKS